MMTDLKPCAIKFCQRKEKHDHTKTALIKKINELDAELSRRSGGEVEALREALRQADGFAEQLEKIKYGYLPETLRGWGRLLRKTIAPALALSAPAAPEVKPCLKSEGWHIVHGGPCLDCPPAAPKPDAKEKL